MNELDSKRRETFPECSSRTNDCVWVCVFVLAFVLARPCLWENVYSGSLRICLFQRPEVSRSGAKEREREKYTRMHRARRIETRTHQHERKSQIREPHSPQARFSNSRKIFGSFPRRISIRAPSSRDCFYIARCICVARASSISGKSLWQRFIQPFRNSDRNTKLYTLIFRNCS